MPATIPATLATFTLVSPARGRAGERRRPSDLARREQRVGTLVIAGAWLETSCEARCAGVRRATRSAARSPKV